VPTLAALGLEVDLAVTPWAYPGPRAPFPGVLRGDAFDQLSGAELDGLATGREVVVAVGCNGAPAALRTKLRVLDGAQAVPMVPGTVANLGVGCSAHVSIRGYVAAAPFHARGRTSPIVALWLDAAQLAVVDATEPNYARQLVRASDYPLELAVAESPDRFWLYESNWGLLRNGSGIVGLGRQVELVALQRAGGEPAPSGLQTGG